MSRCYTIEKIKVNNKLIGPDEPVFIVAEMSGNHNHDLKKAKKIIDEAAIAGADAIKLQTYTADTMTIDCDNEYFQVKVNNQWKGKTLYELYDWAHTPWEWHDELKQHAEKNDLLFFSTPFDETAVEFLEEMDVSLYKVASFELNHIPLLKKIGQTKKPVIVSRGLSSIKDIDLALKTLKNNGCPAVSVLHCVSSYPAEPEQMNLKTIEDISKRFDVVAGLSDHTIDNDVAIASVALGAKIIEKHVTLSRDDGGPDATFSLEPDELKNLIKSVRTVERAIGEVNYYVENKESENISFKRSIFVVKNIKKGEKFDFKNIRVIRPGYGLHPKFYEKIIGKKSTRDLTKGTPLEIEDISE